MDESEELTEDRLLNYLALIAKASPPPWTWEDDPPTLYSGREDNYHGLNLLGRLAPDTNGKANLDFTCAAREGWPATIQALRKLRSRLPNHAGQGEGQAEAWSAVWKALGEAGLLARFSSAATGMERAVEYIQHLKSEADDAKAKLDRLYAFTASALRLEPGEARPHVEVTLEWISRAKTAEEKLGSLYSCPGCNVVYDRERGGGCSCMMDRARLVGAAAKDQNKRLREALLPFAKYVETLDDKYGDGLSVSYYGTSPTVGDCRKAKEVLKEHDDGQ